MHGPMGNSFFTKSVSNMVDAIQSKTPSKNSLFEQAEAYFQTSEKNKAVLSSLKNIVVDISNKIELASDAEKDALSAKLKIARKNYAEQKSLDEDARLSRLTKALEVCSMLLTLCEGENWEKTQVNSAKVLGTLQLLSPCEGKKLRLLHQKLKPSYKGVIALRLLDKLLFDGEFKNDYVTKLFNKETRYPETEGNLSEFQENIALPVLFASIFQDVGLLHPKAQRILKGDDGDLDEFRVLTQEERTALLKINYEQTLDYISFGLGKDKYVGNSKSEREDFNGIQQRRLTFTRTLVIKALNPKLGIGNLIKVPQIYTSIVFSSKPDYNFLDLPKAALVVTNAGDKGAISKLVAQKLLDIVGYFPQGFGITYIPEEDGGQVDRYEYAIVTKLNPEDPYHPVCRVATRHLTFISSGSVITVQKHSNLYFKAAKSRLEKIKPERLKEILSKLVSNFEERKALELIPSYWNPYDFFCYEKLQNLWKKS